MPFPTWIRLALNRMFTKQRRSRSGSRRPLKMQLETLEAREVPATLYVGSALQFSGAGPGGVTWTPGSNFAGFTTTSGLTTGTNAFPDLNAALTQAAADYGSTGNADTIEVAPGTYSGNFNITSPVILQGANSAANARHPFLSISNHAGQYHDHHRGEFDFDFEWAGAVQ